MGFNYEYEEYKDKIEYLADKNNNEEYKNGFYILDDAGFGNLAREYYTYIKPSDSYDGQYIAELLNTCRFVYDGDDLIKFINFVMDLNYYFLQHIDKGSNVFKEIWDSIEYNLDYSKFSTYGYKQDIVTREYLLKDLLWSYLTKYNNKYYEDLLVNIDSWSDLNQTLVNHYYNTKYESNLYGMVVDDDDVVHLGYLNEVE